MTTQNTNERDECEAVPMPEITAKFLCAKCCRSVLIGSSKADEIEELRKRVLLAEDILSDLATGRWVSVLDDADFPVDRKMGQRVIEYWRTFSE